jgi:CO/xanthine dehydrogenase FAD-binding subunit
MAEQPNQVFFPSSYTELFAAWDRSPQAVPYAGGTGLIRRQGCEQVRQAPELPAVILSLEKIEEMHRISRSERYLEIGAMAKLSRITGLGKIVPSALRHCLENIAGPQLRNMATLGGNICFPGRRLDCPAALTALDAQYELRSSQSSRWVSAVRFFADPGPTVLNPKEILTRVRVPLEQWDYSVYKKFTNLGLSRVSGEVDRMSPQSGDTWGEGRSRAVVFLAKTQKNVLSDIRIVYKADSVLRDKNCESVLAGQPLPLSRRIADEFVERWGTFLTETRHIDELSRRELLNFIEINVYNLLD